MCFLPSVKLFRYTRRGAIITEALGESERGRIKGESGNSFASSDDFRHCKASSNATNAEPYYKKKKNVDIHTWLDFFRTRDLFQHKCEIISRVIII